MRITQCHLNEVITGHVPKVFRYLNRYALFGWNYSGFRITVEGREHPKILRAQDMSTPTVHRTRPDTLG